MSLDNSDDFCVICKVNLGQGQKHSESCKFIIELENEKRKVKEDSDKAIAEAQKRLDEAFEKEKQNITEQARKELLDQIEKEKQQIKDLQVSNENKIKEKIIAKILQFDSEKQITKEELDSMNLNELNKYYLKIIKVHVAEKKSNFLINCVKCGTKLGHTITRNEAITILKEHKKSCPKYKSGYGKWILFGIVMLLVSSVAISFAKSNPQLFKKGDSKNE